MNDCTQLAAAFLFGENAQGNPLYLIVGIACLVGGIWYIYKDRKKTKEQREEERKQLSKKFIDNINRNDDFVAGRGDSDEDTGAQNPAPKRSEKKKNGK